MVTQVDLSMWTWKIHKVPPVDEELQTINRGRESVFYRDDTPPPLANQFKVVISKHIYI